MKNFMNTFDISEHKQGRPLFACVGRIPTDFQYRDNLENIFVDDEYGNVWVRNTNGWETEQDAFNFLCMTFLRAESIPNQPKITPIVKMPQRQSSKRTSVTQQTIVEERKNSWYDNNEVPTERLDNPQIQQLPRRNRPRNDQIQVSSNQQPQKQSIIREPANRTTMDYLKKMF